VKLKAITFFAVVGTSVLTYAAAEAAAAAVGLAITCIGLHQRFP